jgi:hypothetical protein
MLIPSSASVAVSRPQSARTGSLPGADAGNLLPRRAPAREHLAREPEHVVADGVALGVVDLLHVVHVREDQAERATGLEARGQRRVEGARVQQPGQVVALAGDPEPASGRPAGPSKW